MSAYQSNQSRGTLHKYYVEPCAGGKPEHFGERHLGAKKTIRRRESRFCLQQISHLDKDKETGKIVINPEQAETVKLIYHLFLEGMTPHSIAAELTSRGIKTPAGKDVWNQQTVRWILSKPDIFDLRQRHNRPDARKPLESANLLAPGAFSFMPCSPGCTGTVCFAEAGFLLPRIREIRYT